MVNVQVLLCLLAATGVALGGYSDPTCAPGRTVITHLFNWKWTEIAKECERYLGPNGFCGLQVSPPNEHRIVMDPTRPWWERYQPVSYQLITRSGDEAQFTDMVRRCNAVNVRVYVDAVVNHMTGSDGSGTGSGGSSFNAGTLQFPAVPYGPDDFNCCYCSSCNTGDCNIQNYGDVNQVRNCRLVSLVDIKLGSDYARQKVADYFNHLISIGVAGFRIDALKHMWPGDTQAILDRTNNLNTEWWPANTRPFFFNEVIDLGGEPIKATEYTHLGRVTEFKYSSEIGKAFRRRYALSNLKTIGPSWGMLPSDSALIFVDNHDNQRGHGAGGAEVLTFYEPREYKMATAFTLANWYAFTRIMSSYSWPGGRWSNDWYGPPYNPDWSIKDVPINADGSCGDDWVCEHRWRQIANMVKFRNVVEGEPVANWWDNGNNQIAFSRGSKGFLAINNEVSANMDISLATGMSPGTYCDVISGNLEGATCTGKQIVVDTGGRAQIRIGATDEDPIIAFHSGSQLNTDGSTVSTTTGAPTTTQPPPEGYARTVVLLYKQTSVGQDAFLRGGINHERRPGCTSDASTSACAISIAHRNIGIGSHYEGYNAWKAGNTKLNWYGAQAGQGTYNGVAAQGSPMVWTTNDQGHPGYQPPNTYGPHYWLLDVDMNCSETESGWFELKAFITNLSTNGGWETDISQVTSCTGTSGGSKPYSSTNHFARCGFINVFTFGANSCEINNF